MKKTLLVLIACMLAGPTFSQITFGPKAGFILSKYATDFKESGFEPNEGFRMGPSIGAVMDLPLCDFVSFQPSAMFSIKGSAENLSKGRPWHPNHTYDGYNRDRILYFEIPATFAGKLELGPGTAQLLLGPYFAMALAGGNYYDYTETSMDGTVTTHKGDEKIKFTNEVDESDLEVEGVAYYKRRMDCGMTIGVAYIWRMILFSLVYNWGFINLTPNYNISQVDYDPADERVRNQGIAFTVAWLFGAK